MNDDIDEFNEEVEELEDEEKGKKAPSKKKEAIKETEETTDRYVAFYQEAKIGIVDTITKEFVVDTLKDYGTAQIEAFKLNKLDKIAIASGVQ
ncbi:hypothetical protein LCGC14_0996450 [marine sediment metagenome]|uniref:Uncharacterized protein n=1 Tax=marine sediment metagenome TaxID=412755 RepID=A0A0F9N4B2_9ZZZZ